MRIYKTRKLNNTVRAVSAVLCAAVMIVIFILSHQPGEASDKVSISLTAFLLGGNYNTAEIINFLVRKIAHMIEFAALSAPAFIFASTFRIKKAVHYYVPILSTVVYSVFDELHQYFVPGRACELSDVITDGLGAVIGVAVVGKILYTFEKDIDDAENERYTKSCINVLDAFSAHITGGECLCEPVTSRNVGVFIKTAYAQKLLPMAFSAVDDSGKFQIPDTVYRGIKSSAMHDVISQINRNIKFLEFYKAATDAGLKPLCIKGAACRVYYRNPDLRISGDEDIVVADGEFEKCVKILKNLGFISGERDISDFETAFTHPQSGCRIELHRKLFPGEGEIYKRFNELVGDIHSDSTSVMCDGVEVFCPSAERHMLYLAFHAFKHFATGGVGIRQVADISLLAANNEIDWKFVFEKCKIMRTDGFLNALLVISNRYFGLDISGIKAEVPKFDENDDIEPLVCDIMTGGIYGNENIDRKHSGRVTFERYSSGITGAKPRKLTPLFPSANEMKKKYRYVKKHPVLLPAAWLSRLFSYITSEHDSSQSVNFIRKRTLIMKKYRIIR